MSEDKKKPVKPRKNQLPAEAFASKQMNLFQNFLANADASEGLSNAIDLWDMIPRYSVSKLRMASLRTEDGFLDPIEIPFVYRGRPLAAIIHPARIKIKDGGALSFFPGAREELVELALRKISSEQAAGFFDSQGYRSGVRFTLSQLRKELAARGHELRSDEIIQSLDILSLSAIEIVGSDGSDQAFARSTYLPSLAGVRRQQYEAKSAVKWVAHFHPLVTQSIDHLTYRQFNYHRLMRCRTQLARWLINQLVLKYTQASPMTPFEMRYSTIKRDSALLDGYCLERLAIGFLDRVWEELRELGTIVAIQRTEHRGARAKLLDVCYKISPSREFVAEQKAANRRRLDAQAPVSAMLENG